MPAKKKNALAYFFPEKKVLCHRLLVETIHFKLTLIFELSVSRFVETFWPIPLNIFSTETVAVL